LIDRQPFAPSAYIDNGVSVYRPYSLLLAYNYGSGNGSITYSSDNGFMTDADSFGIRLDYAVAANLNTFASLFYAQRVSQGYPWGFIRPNPNALEAPEIQFAFRFLRGGGEIGFADPGPNILERDLGYEIGFGLEWQLLEGYNLTAHFAYWQPGDWFKFACVDRSVPNWDNPTALNNWGINPDRGIEPIFGLNAKFEMEF
jgi:hypothetical protein